MLARFAYNADNLPVFRVGALQQYASKAMHTEHMRER